METNKTFFNFFTDTLVINDTNITDIQINEAEDFNINLKILINALAKSVYEMLLNDYPKLINLLYRIDVDEKKYQESFLNKDLKIASEQIAELIIKRLIEKWNYRLQFGNI